MGQACQVCDHKNRVEIDRALVSGRSKASLSRECGVSEASLLNHEKNHVTRQLLKSHEIMERASADALLNEIDSCMVKAKAILKQAEDDKKPGLQLQALKEIRQTIEFLSRLAIAHATLAQERELAGMATGTNGQRTVVVLPAKIDPGMDATEAGRVYKNFLKTIGENPGADFRYAEDQSEPEPEQDEPSRPMTRKRPSSAERIKAAAAANDQEEDDLSGMVGPDILNWQPVIPPKQSTWGR